MPRVYVRKKKRPMPPLTTAERRLVEENYGLAWKAAHQVYRGLPTFLRLAFEVDDLAQQASLSLMRCAQLFRPELDNQFSTYAMSACVRRIRQYLAKNSLIATPAWEPGEVCREQAYKAKIIRSLHEELTHRHHNNPPREVTVLDLLSTQPTHEKDAQRAEEVGGIPALLEKLPARERRVLELYYLEERTLEAVGAALEPPVSKERARQLLLRAVALLNPARAKCPRCGQTDPHNTTSRCRVCNAAEYRERIRRERRKIKEGKENLGMADEP